ncbi:hypothetical protein BDZ89DRAFT_1059241 [Hymenopellis radicata]|nr:hypothetical protein BDZ89DRAFT_1059241 [Hymenopellis radicata]
MGSFWPCVSFPLMLPDPAWAGDWHQLTCNTLSLSLGLISLTDIASTRTIKTSRQCGVYPKTPIGSMIESCPCHGTDA